MNKHIKAFIIDEFIGNLINHFNEKPFPINQTINYLESLKETELSEQQLFETLNNSTTKAQISLETFNLLIKQCEGELYE